MNNTIRRNLIAIPLALVVSSASFAEEQKPKKEVQDMSDPLAVYTQLGAGYTDKGLNFKVGQSYDSGKPATMAMNLIEIKGVLGDALGSRDNLDDDVDSIRFRNFIVNTNNGRGSQVDVIYNLDTKSGSASYSLIQALPKMSILQFFPLAGVGLAVANNVNEHPLWAEPDAPSGFSVPGAFVMVGTYSKVTVTDKFWLNYNPIWLKGVAGSDAYLDNAYGFGDQNVFTHEAAVNYQITPVMNVRYFANWSNNLSFNDGDHRVELNYQL